VSTPSSPERLPRGALLALAGMALFSLAAYLWTSQAWFRAGFPLDDSWIHQTYARNLALRGEWAFVPGRPSGGSTAPLWTAILALGPLLHLGPLAWTWLAGGLLLWGLAVLAEGVVRCWAPGYRPRFPWVGAVFTLEWHLVWSAGSGMETLLYATLATLTLVLIASGARRAFGLGVLIGASVWARPDGVTLLGPALLAALLSETDWMRRVRALSGLAIGFGSLFAPYLVFNLALAGSPWPGTFYAKQAEYGAYLQMPYLVRFGGEALQPLIGAGIALLPGVAIFVVSALRKRQWGRLLGLAWAVGYLGLYAWRLPVTYQHGRYVIPAMPFFFLAGAAGLVDFALRPRRGYAWIAPFFWKTVTAALLLVFWVLGGVSYARDVAVIESEMVDTARWVSTHVPEDMLVAAHDIGALGYFGGRDLVDLAGLISPEVVPFLRDEERLARYLDERQVGVLVTFPGWYPSLTRGRVPVFVTGSPYAPAMGEENMAVYYWRQP